MHNREQLAYRKWDSLYFRAAQLQEWFRDIEDGPNLPDIIAVGVQEIVKMKTKHVAKATANQMIEGGETGMKTPRYHLEYCSLG